MFERGKELFKAVAGDRQLFRDTKPDSRDAESHARDSEPRNGVTEPHKIMPERAYLLHSLPPMRPPPKSPALGLAARSGNLLGSSRMVTSVPPLGVLGWEVGIARVGEDSPAGSAAS